MRDERGMYFEEVQQVFRVSVRPIVIGERNITVPLTVVDGLSVGHSSEFGSCYVCGVGAAWARVGIASWAVVELTGRG